MLFAMYTPTAGEYWLTVLAALVCTGGLFFLYSLAQYHRENAECYRVIAWHFIENCEETDLLPDAVSELEKAYGLLQKRKLEKQMLGVMLCAWVASVFEQSAT